MFVICSAVLIVVSLLTPAPDRRKLAGLTFSTVEAKLATVEVAGHAKPAQETAAERRINIAFSILLTATVICLWVYFR
jgi:hypothetical protein